MDKEEKLISDRTGKIKEWFKDPYNLTLVGIIVLALAIRIYYFIQTNGQALWWDEAEYMATAKHWAFNVPYALNPQRPPLFQFLAALSFMAGLGENFIKFVLVLLPSTIMVYAFYLLGKEMYDKRVGLISAFFAAVGWSFLFWTSRLQPDFLSMVFSVLSIFFMWKHWKNDSTKLAIWSGIFAALGFYFKISGLFVPMIFFLFLIIKERWSMFTNKYNYYFAISFLLTMVPYFIWSYLTFGRLFAFTQGYLANPVPQSVPFGWYNFNFYYYMTEGVVFILFLIGAILGLKFLLYLDVLAKDKKKCFDPNLFSILAMLFISAIYIFHFKGTDDRWVYMWLPFIFSLVGVASVFIYDVIKKYNKGIAIAVVLILLAIGGFMQLAHNDALTKNKLTSYMPVKLAGIWIKDNSVKTDEVISISYTQMVYYSERNVTNLETYTLISNATDLNSYVINNRPRFIEVSVFEPHPQWLLNWIEANKNILTPVQAYFSDQTKQQAVLVIYEIKY